MNNLECALKYAEIGWYVFPVHYVHKGQCSCGKKDCNERDKGKHPATPNGHKNATHDTKQIKRWWTKNPNWNIGIAVGPRSNLSVMDIDPRNSGDKSYKALIEKYGPLPVTPVDQSGGGGNHVYFSYNNLFGIPKEFKKGIDIKNNGYIIAPNSIHLSGKRYKWQDGREPWHVPLAEVPEWLQIDKTQHAPSDTFGNSMEHLEKLSGAEELKGEVIDFKQNSNGTHQIIVDGKSTGCWIDHNGFIGSNDKGGPTAIQWIEWYGYSTEDAYKIALKYDVDVNSKHNNLEELEVLEVISTRLFPIIPFPLKVLPNNLQIFIKRASIAFGIPINIVASCVLNVLATMIGNTIRISPKFGWLEPVFLWLMIIGKSGSGKSPLVNKLMSPIYDIEKLEHLRYEAEVRKFNEETKGNKTSDSPPPKRKRIIVNDTTTEALALSMLNNSRGVLIYQDELSAFIKSHDQYKQGRGSDRQKYLELWNCQPWFIDRVTRGSIFVKDTGCGILGGIQEMVLPTIFNQQSLVDGLLARFLVSWMEQGHVHYTKKTLSKEDMQAWKNYIEICKSILMIQEDGFNTPYIISFDAYAQAAFMRFANNNTSLGRYLDEKFSVFIPKLNSYCVRLAGILHVIYGNDLQDQISLKTITEAIEITRYFSGQAMDMMNRYGQESKKLTEIDLLVLVSIYNLQDIVKNGRLFLSKIVESVNSRLPEAAHQTSTSISSILRNKFKLSTDRSNYAYLVWESSKINNLFLRYITPSKSSKSSNEQMEMPEYDSPVIVQEEEF